MIGMRVQSKGGDEPAGMRITSFFSSKVTGVVTGTSLTLGSWMLSNRPVSGTQLDKADSTLVVFCFVMWSRYLPKRIKTYTRNTIISLHLNGLKAYHYHQEDRTIKPSHSADALNRVSFSGDLKSQEYQAGHITDCSSESNKSIHTSPHENSRKPCRPSIFASPCPDITDTFPSAFPEIRTHANLNGCSQDPHDDSPQHRLSPYILFQFVSEFIFRR